MTQQERCGCEHSDHFGHGTGHAYQAAFAGAAYCRELGAHVCDDCAAGHYADLVTWPVTR